MHITYHFHSLLAAPLPTSWTDQLQPVTIAAFTSHVGPTVPIPDTPLEVFELFFTPDLQEKIVVESNRYARQVMGDQRYDSWTKITREELKAFIGFSILMGINRLPSLDDYWSKDELLHYAPISKRIPRWRFREISRYLHFVNNDDLAPRGDPMHDRLGKVRPLIDHLSDKFRSLYDPSRDVAVDEAVSGAICFEAVHADEANQAWDQSVGTGGQYQWLLQ